MFILRSQQRLGPMMACESQGSSSRGTFLLGSPEAHMCPPGSYIMACKSQASPSSTTFLRGATMWHLRCELTYHGARVTGVPQQHHLSARQPWGPFLQDVAPARQPMLQLSCCDQQLAAGQAGSPCKSRHNWHRMGLQHKHAAVDLCQSAREASREPWTQSAAGTGPLKRGPVYKALRELFDR